MYVVGSKESKMVYVGETKKTASQRIKEHKGDTRNGHIDKSAIAEQSIYEPARMPVKSFF